MSDKKYLVIIQGDCGHLDYVYTINEVDEVEKDRIIKALDLIDDFEEKFHPTDCYPDHNVEHLAEYLDKSWDPIEDIMLLVWFFDFYMPEGREDCDTDCNSGCHTLSHYKIYEISDIVRDSVGSF